MPCVAYARSLRTTLRIDDEVMKRLKQEAALRGRTMSEPLEAALRLLLDESEGGLDRAGTSPLRSFSMGRPFVDVSDREALYGAMGGN